MTEWILYFIERGGYWGIAFLMFVETVFPPIPSEVIMGLGGIAVGRGTMQFWPLLVVGTLGSTLGNYVWFLAANRLGYERMRPVVDRWGRWMTMEWEDVERASHFFRRHGQWIVLGFRLSPFMRTMVSVPAGLTHMKHGKFLAFTFVGGAVWNSVLIAGGHWLAHYEEEMRDWLGWGIAGGILLLVGAYVWRVITWQPRR